jgi:hypothetical protein
MDVLSFLSFLSNHEKRKSHGANEINVSQKENIPWPTTFSFSMFREKREKREKRTLIGGNFFICSFQKNTNKKKGNHNKKKRKINIETFFSYKVSS